MLCTQGICPCSASSLGRRSRGYWLCLSTHSLLPSFFPSLFKHSGLGVAWVILLYIITLAKYPLESFKVHIYISRSMMRLFSPYRVGGPSFDRARLLIDFREEKLSQAISNMDPTHSITVQGKMSSRQLRTARRP